MFIELKKSFILLYLIFCVPNLFALEPSIIKKQISAKQSSIIPFYLKKREYIKGSYKVSKDIKTIQILNNKKEAIKDLYISKRLEDRFLFIFDKEGKYYFKTSTLDKDVELTINIEKVIPKEKQISSNKIKYLSPTLAKIKSKKDLNIFWDKIKKEGTPLIEKKDKDTYIITYLYKGAKENVKIMGAPIGDHPYMDRFKNSDLWYKSYEVPKGTKFSYRLAPDVPNIPGNTWDKRVAILSSIQVDPYNKHPMEFSKDFDKYNRFSTFTLDEQKYKDYSKGKAKEKGSIENYKLKSKILKNERAIDIYKPKGFLKNKNYPILFLFDGKEYQSKVNTPKILDNLIASKKIPPIITVFISNVSHKSRSKELPCNDNFVEFMDKELLPWIKKNITKNIDPKWNILSGSSYGGLASTYIAFKKPNSFNKVLSISGSFWWKNKPKQRQWLIKEFAKAKSVDIELILYAGIFETGRKNTDILQSNRHFRDVLIAKDYKVNYKEFNGGHDYFSWNDVLADGLIHLLKHYPQDQ